MGLGAETEMTDPGNKESGPSIAEYDSCSALTDKLDPNKLTPVLLGLFGEVGSLMTTSKKYHREGEAYTAYQGAIVEEFGDILWYLAALCRRTGDDLADIVAEASGGDDVSSGIVASTLAEAPIAFVRSFTNQTAIDDLLLHLGQHAAALLETVSEKSVQRERLIEFTRTYLRAVQAHKVPFAVIAQTNLAKIQGRFLEYTANELPDFDAKFPEEEQLPRTFQIKFGQPTSGKSYMRWNGVFIGDPLTDSIEDPDGYRFHDVFHLAHAAVLHWSPTFRALIRQKRKSDPGFDENQDGGRARVVEEGLTAYIFSCAKELNFFEGQKSISFDLLKTIRNFVRGYEVEQCPLKLWEDAILQGYEVFRLLRANNGGTVVGNRATRTIAYTRVE